MGALENCLRAVIREDEAKKMNINPEAVWDDVVDYKIRRVAEELYAMLKDKVE